MTAAENSNFISHVNASDAKLTSVEKAAYAVLVIQHCEESVSLAGRRSTERDVVAYQSCPDQCVCILYPSLAATHDMCLPLGPEYHRPPCYVARWAGPAYARVHAAHVPSHVRASPTMCAGGESSARLSFWRFALVAAVVPARVLSARAFPHCFLLVCCDYT